MLTPHGDLAIAELIYYVPAFFLSIFALVVIKFRASLYIGALCAIRVAGSALLLVAQEKNNHNLLTTSLILSSVGLSPLLLAMLNMLSRVHESMQGHGLPQWLFVFGHIPTLVALILAVIGGEKQTKNGSSNTSKGKEETKIAIIIFLAVYAVQTAITFFTFMKMRYVAPVERRLVYALGLSLPFLLVRLIYSVLSYFYTASNTFNLETGSAVVQGFMAVMMEFFIVIFYLGAGLSLPSSRKQSWNRSKNPGYPMNHQNQGGQY